MAQSRHRARVVSREVLKGLAVAGAVGGVLVAPNAAGLIDRYLKKMDKRDAKRTLHYLKYRKLIDVRKKDGVLHYKLTSKGRDKYKTIEFDEMSIKTPLRWDRKWRVIAFDLPAEKRVQRRELLRKIKQLDFYMLQQSMWVHPFDCEKQIGVLIDTLGVEEYVSFMVVERGNFNSFVERHFKRQGLLV
jgi:DNA-binding transcriptional regulator PaaX